MKYLYTYKIFESQIKPNLLTIIKNVINQIKKEGLSNTINDYRYHANDDSKAFNLTFYLVNFINKIDMGNWIKYDVEVENFWKKLNLFDKEYKKEYSELKYTLIEELSKERIRLIKKEKELKDDIIMYYYETTGEDMLKDIDVAINYLKTSKYINQEKHKEVQSKFLRLLEKFKILLSDSNITNQMKNIIS